MLLCQSNYCRPEDFGGPRQVEPGRPLCRVCADRLGPTLRRIAGMWPDLRARVAIEGSAGEKVTGTKVPGLVINEEVSALCSAVAGWTERARSHVQAAHPMAQRPRTLDTPAVLEWLAKYHAWRLAYDGDHERAVGVCEWAEVYRREVRRLAYPSGTRRLYPRDARCLAVVIDADADDGPHGFPTRTCGGQLYALIRPGGSTEPSELVCVIDDTHRVPSKQWLTWARRGVRRDGRDQRIPDGGGDRHRSRVVDQNGVQPGK
jgi:hypothetical protein